MPNPYFQFKQFRINQPKGAMKVTTEGCILGAWAGYENPGRILDIGTGTGLLSLMLAQKYPHAKIDAVEIQKGAFEEAMGNFESSRWKETISIFHQPIQEFDPGYQYDLIVSNPPFFSDSLRSTDEGKNKAKHEGSLTQLELISALKRLLNTEGHAFVLYPELEMNLFVDLGKQHGLFPVKRLTVRNKRMGKVFRQIVALSHFQKTTIESELVIKNGEMYTPDFIGLMREYYLIF